MFAGLLLLLGCGLGLSAQTHSAPADAAYPEQSCLSPTRYVNEYFDFTFDIPSEAHLRTKTVATSRNGNIEILELAGPPPVDAEISIVAIPTASGNSQDAKTYMRAMLDHELYIGVEELRGLTKVMLNGHPFYLFETRRGIDQHVVFASVVGDYVVRTVVAAHDEKVVRQLDVAFEHLVFFAPAQLNQHAPADCRFYDGPSISSHRLAMLEADPPAKRIDSGKLNGDFYENSMLGFSYRIPQGWVLRPQGQVQPAVENYRQREQMGRPSMGRTERILLDACSRTLFSAWAQRPGADGQSSYDSFGEVTVSAMALSCFPRMKFPTEAKNTQAFQDFIAQFALTHPIVDDVNSAKVFTEDGITFLYLHGTVAFQEPGDELSRRLSLAMAITQRGNYLLTWFFAAPHDTELQALTNERAIFDPLPPAKEANLTQPGGADEPPISNAPTAAASTPAAAAAKASAPASAATAAPSPSNAGASASTAAPGNDSNESTQPPSSAPSLLRPGESVESQQGNGTVIKKK